jgi:SAM-dependent methyltransferase
VIERSFTEDRLAALYDLFYPPRARDDFAFYLPLIMSADSVLDVGCGTGALLRWAREEGHAGRLVGLDPAPGMLNQARSCADIEWVLGDLTTVGWDGDFDLVVMTGHAFQELVEDDEIRRALRAIRTSLVHDGRFAFETRNPLDRAWERWPAQYSGKVTLEDGTIVRRQNRIVPWTEGDVVRSEYVFTSPHWEHPEESQGALRFVDRDTLFRFLDDAGFAIDEQYGDWDRQQLTDGAPEIITIARKRGR